MWVRKIISVFALSTFFFSCSLNRNVDDNSLFIEEEGMYKKNIKEFEFALKPYSSGKLAMINYKNSIDHLPKTQKDSILKEYDNYTCFLLEVNVKGFQGEISDYDSQGMENDQAKKLNYYLFGMQQDIMLVDAKGDQYPCVIYYHERMNEVNRSNRFIIGFNKPTGSEVSFEYNNRFINCGKIKFNIEEQHLALK